MKLLQHPKIFNKLVEKQFVHQTHWEATSISCTMKIITGPLAEKT